MRALFALGKLSPSLQSDVLADGAVETRWKILVKQTLPLGKGLSVNRANLFAVFRACADGEEIPALLDDSDSPLDAKASLGNDGSIVIELPGQQMKFTHAILFSSDPNRRVSALDAIFHELTLSHEEQERLRCIARRPDYSDADFIFIAKSLSSSLEEFVGRLQAKANVRQISYSDILPDEPQHWTNLTAARRSSETLAQFIDGELLDERKARFAMNGASAFRTIALTFSSPGLVPHVLFDTLDSETMTAALEDACSFVDHFSLVGAFETCARLISKDQRFVDLGERILDHLFADMTKLQTSCGMFGAAFVIAIARLAEDEALTEQPAYWRRLAAAAQAALVVRACDVTDINHDDLFKWAMAQSGESYCLSILSDFVTDPQWRPEWIVHRFLVADAIGRAWGALDAIPLNNQPEGWRSRIDVVRDWAKANQIDMLLGFPALMEGARRPPLSISILSEPIQEAYRQLETEPSLENLFILTPVIHAFGFPVETREGLQKVIGVLRRSPHEAREITQAALTLLAHIAALANDVNLANGVAEICIEQIASADGGKALLEAMLRIIECGAADPDRSASQATLLRRLEQAAFLVPVGPLVTDLQSLLAVLKSVNLPLRQRLGRALALVNLGVSRFNVA
jgi:hypothetical protein